MAKAKGSGCLGLFFSALLGVLTLYWLSRGVYHLLLPKTAVPLAFFQGYILSFSEYYTTYSGGSLSARLLFALMGCMVLWFVCWGAVLALSTLSGNGSSDRWSGPLFVLLIICILFTMYSSLSTPSRIAVFNVKEQQMETADFRPMLLFWRIPVASNRQEIPFSEIRSFRYVHYEESIMGASHQEIDLFAVTSSDTIVIGHKMVHHGEFSYFTGWRSMDTILAEAKKDADLAVRYLEDLISNQLP